MPPSEYPRERVERAARMYATNKDAAAAMGCTSASFSRMCRKYGIETPWHRSQRKAGRA